MGKIRTLKISAIIFFVSFILSSISAAITHNDLKKYLIDLPGWKADPPQGMTMESGNFKVINATRTYKKGKKSLFVTINYGHAANQINMNAPSGFKMETDTELMFTKNVNGKTVNIFYSKNEKSGTITVLISPKLVLAINYENMNWEEALELAQKFNWKKLESIK